MQGSSSVPQGSIRGPKLFILYINDICNISPVLNFILFADNTPGNSHPNGTVKANANINSKQTTLKTTDNYVYTYLLCFMSLLYVFYSISAIMDDKKSLI